MTNFKNTIFICSHRFFSDNANHTLSTERNATRSLVDAVNRVAVGTARTCLLRC